MTFAYEVELSPKSLDRYEAILRFYKSQRDVTQVFWLIDSTDIKDQIIRAKNCIRDESQNFHVFVELEDYLKNGWDANIANERSENLGSIRQKYQGLCGDLIRDLLGTLRGNSTVTVHLRNQKVLGKSRR